MGIYASFKGVVHILCDMAAASHEVDVFSNRPKNINNSIHPQNNEIRPK